MKRSILLSATLISFLFFTSCSDDNNDANNGFGNLSTVVLSGVRTNTANNYNYWKAVPNIELSNTGANYSYWSLHIGNYTGYLHERFGNENSWKGYTSYKEKNKKCDDIVHTDSLYLDITTNESGWGKVTYRTISYTYNEGESPSSLGAIENIYFIKPDSAGNINTLNVYNMNNVYQFSFKTQVKDDFNSWKFSGIPDGWMSSEARMGMLIVPVFFTVFQL
jgi:hypothetical protein